MNMHSFILFIYSFSTLSLSPNFIFLLSTLSAPITAFLPSNCCCLLRRRATAGSLMAIFPLFQFGFQGGNPIRFDGSS